MCKPLIIDFFQKKRHPLDINENTEQKSATQSKRHPLRASTLAGLLVYTRIPRKKNKFHTHPAVVYSHFPIK